MKRRDVVIGGLALAAAPAFARALPAAIGDYEQASGGHVGFYAENIATGRKLTWRADERFVMCSTFKASLAALVLRRVEQRHDDLAARIAYGASELDGSYAPVAEANVARGYLTVEEMCAAAVQYSDNVCANLLLARVGGPEAITAFWRRLGDDASRLDDPEPLLNRTPAGGVKNTTTPRAMASTFGKLVLGTALGPVQRNRFTDWLIGSKTGANRLRLGLPQQWVTGDKTGNNGKDAAGDLAVTWIRPGIPIIITAYTRGGHPTPAQLEAVFRGVGALAVDRLALHG